jgi:hypothetical protein
LQRGAGNHSHNSPSGAELDWHPAIVAMLQAWRLREEQLTRHRYAKDEAPQRWEWRWPSFA